MDHSLEIRHCRVLVALSEHGSVSAAARALGLAQSTVSEVLLSLERVIGAPVTLRRRGQHSTLSVKATTLLPNARALISASEAALASVNPTTRVMRLGSVESASTYLLPQALAAFRRQWPSIELKISIGVCNDLRRKVQSGELDAAITLENSTEGAADPCNYSRVLAPTQLCLFVARGMTLIKHSLSHEKLARYPLLLPDPDGAFNTLLRNWFASNVDRPRIESAGSIDGVKIGVRNSDYVGVLPNYAIAKELKSGEFVRLRVRQPLPSIALGLTTRHTPVAASPLHDMIQYIERAIIPHTCLGRSAAATHH